VSGQLHAPAALPPGKEPLVPIAINTKYSFKVLFNVVLPLSRPFRAVACHGFVIRLATGSMLLP
jgi:hypothetical protein